MDKQTNSTIYDGNCTDRNFQIFVAGRHSISEWDFNAWVRNYNTAALPGKQMDAEVLSDMIDAVNCSDYHIEVGPPGDGEGYPDRHSDIELNIVARLIKTYSIALFRGIIYYCKPDTFYFYKARKFERHFDIIFKAEKNGVPVYYGDISDSNP